ncbi:MAG TPA: phosphotransferase [Candidatus Sabulitectum sp.]|nr:phosphotransferase [Candidatus Sabulitectum sp.]
MDRKISDRFSDGVAQEALDRFGGDDCRELGGFESFMFRFSRDGEELVLRISHSLRRTGGMILGEAMWLRYLAENRVPVAEAVLSAAGKLVEEIPDGAGGTFLATAFRFIHGVTPWQYGWNRELFVKYGALMGRMHRLTRGYDPERMLRPHWSDPSLGGEIRKMIPPGQHGVLARHDELMERACALPVSLDSYGLVHYDAHGGNMLVTADGNIVLFDFDDCCRSWFAADIAIALFYAAVNRPDPEAAADDFLVPFLSGYSTENALSPRWLATIPLFLSIRELDLYAVIHRSMNLNDLDPWCAAFMKDRRGRIEAGEPFLDLDFSGYTRYIQR